MLIRKQKGSAFYASRVLRLARPSFPSISSFFLFFIFLRPSLSVAFSLVSPTLLCQPVYTPDTLFHEMEVLMNYTHAGNTNGTKFLMEVGKHDGERDACRGNRGVYPEFI